MREFLNGILLFIGGESLTDEEFDSISLENTDDLLLVYEALLPIVQARDSVSDMAERLRNYFLAKGISIDEAQTSSNILVGGALWN